MMSDGQKPYDLPTSDPRRPLVGVVAGSFSDKDVLEETLKALDHFKVGYDVRILSAHRTPEDAAEYAKKAEDCGLEVLICLAGHAAHLAGVMASYTTLPVLGVPVDSSALNGLDSLLATVQMPQGTPVGTMAIGKSGAYNAGIFAVKILATTRVRLATALKKYQKELAEKVRGNANNDLQDYLHNRKREK